MKHWQALLLVFVGAGVLYGIRHLAGQSVDVKYFGRADLASYACTDVTRSSLVKRVCFDRIEGRMLIDLSGTYYAYCSIPESTVSALLASGSMGQFYNLQIKRRYPCG
jgi:hypothetical protein